MSTDSPTSTPEPTDTARLLVEAEREVAGRRARDVAGRPLAASAVADLLAALTLLLPWAGTPAAPIAGLHVSIMLSGVVLISMALRQVVLRAAAAAPDASCYPVVLVVAGWSTIAAGLVWAQQPMIAQAIARGSVSPLPPAGFAVAFLAGGGFAWLAAARMRQAVRGVDLLADTFVHDPAWLRERFAAAVEDAVRRPAGHGWYPTLGVAGLVLAAAGLLAPWHLQATTLLTPDPSDYVFPAAALPDTLVLRWTVAIGLAGVLAVLAIARLRPLRPDALLVSGTAVVTFATRHVLHDATALHGTGYWLTVTGGGLAVGAGAIGRAGRATVPRRRRAALGVALVAAVVCAGVVGPIERAAPTSTALLPVAGTRVTVDEVEAEDAEDAQPHVVVGSDGRVWSLRRVDAQHVVLNQHLAGHVVPTTLITVPALDSLELIAAPGGEAVLSGVHPYDAAGGKVGVANYVSVVRLGVRDAAVGPARRTATPRVSRTVLRADPDRTAKHARAGGRDVHAGLIRTASLTVRPVADGSMIVSLTDSSGQYPARNYLVPAAEVTSRNTWTLDRELPGDSPVYSPLTSYAADGSRWEYGVSAGNSAVMRVTADGTRRVVLGGVSDERCTTSRDPLSTFLAVPNGTYAATIDRRGDLWLPLETGSGNRLVVLTPDGILRRPAVPMLGAVEGLAAAPDGSLLITTSTESENLLTLSTERLVGADEVARRATAFPPSARDCVSENRAHATVVGRGVRPVTDAPVAGLGPSRYAGRPVVTRPDGTVLWTRGIERNKAYVTELMRTRPGHVPEFVTTTGNVVDLVADGRGGAWWLGATSLHSAGKTVFTVWHLDAAGEVQLMADPVLPRVAPSPDATVNPQDGSLLWRIDEPAGRWHRTTLDRHTTLTPYVGDRPSLNGDVGYVADQHGGRLLHDLRPVRAVGGSGSARSSLSIGAAAGGRVSPALVDADRCGALVTRDGRVVLYDGSGIGRLDGDRVTLLGGPLSRLATNEVYPTVLVDDVFFVGSDRRVYRIRVS